MCELLSNEQHGTRSHPMTDLLVRTGLFITLTIGSSALMALPYIA